MTLTADIDDDYLYVDGTIAVTLTDLGGTTHAIGHALNLPLSKRQAAAIGPVALEDEHRSFGLPVAELDSVEPQQGMAITDDEGVIWRILSAERKTISTRWMCPAVKTRLAAEQYMPVVTVPGAKTINSAASRSFTGTSFTFSGTTAKVLLSVNHGTLTLAGTTGLTFVTGDGTADASMSFTGTVAACNTALLTLTYNPDTSYSGTSATITVEVQDASEATAKDVGTIALTVSTLYYGLVAQYKLNEASGDALDSFGGNDATAVNAPGSSGSARTLVSALAQYFDAGDIAAFEFAGSFTVACQFNLTSATGLFRPIVSKTDNDDPTNSQVTFAVTSTGRLQSLFRTNAATSKTVTHGTTLTAATWYHGAMRFVDQTTLGLKLNDGAEETVSCTGVSMNPTSTAPFRIGAYNPISVLGAVETFGGSLRFLKLWNRALTDLENTEDYNGGNGVEL